MTSRSEATPAAWQPIETAPRDGSSFLVAQSDEVYHARYDEHGRIMWRTHTWRQTEVKRLVDVRLDGDTRQGYVVLNRGDERFDHNWCLWTRGFDFAPTHWMPLPTVPNEESDGSSPINPLVLKGVGIP